MKTIILLSSFLVSTSLWAQCANKIDNSKVMMFDIVPKVVQVICPYRQNVCLYCPELSTETCR